jgi:hypothetical protein
LFSTVSALILIGSLAGQAAKPAPLPLNALARLATGDGVKLTPDTVVQAPYDPQFLKGVDVWGGVGRAVRGAGGATDWELFQIQQNPGWWGRVIFYQDGVVVPNPFE